MRGARHQLKVEIRALAAAGSQVAHWPRGARNRLRLAPARAHRALPVSNIVEIIVLAPTIRAPDAALKGALLVALAMR